MMFLLIGLLCFSCAMGPAETNISEASINTTASANDDYVKDLLAHRDKLNKQYKDKETSPFKHNKDRKQFEQLNFFDPSMKYKLTARVEKIEDGPVLEFPTSAGTIKKYQENARLHFDIDDATYTLTVYKNEKRNPAYPNHLFLPFTDLTSGEECYGGGRYIDMEGPLGETVELDFNYAYNPYCAYSDGWFCPIPPENNFINVRIEAGEKVYWQDDKH